MTETVERRLYIDILATSLGCTTKKLKSKLEMLGLMQIVSEAERVQHRELFDTKAANILNPPAPTLQHYREAAKRLLPEIIEGWVLLRKGT